MNDPLALHFAGDGFVPNNPLPMLLYKYGIDLSGTPDPEERIEAVFAENGWGREMWRNGIYEFTHFHSSIHEVLAIARGRATVRFGGSNGQEIEVGPGDVALLPAGTGHQRLKSTKDLMVIGGYPAGGTYDLCRGSKADHDRAVKAIPGVPLPDTDPVYGAGGPLLKLWRAK